MNRALHQGFQDVSSIPINPQQFKFTRLSHRFSELIVVNRCYHCCVTWTNSSRNMEQQENTRNIKRTKHRHTESTSAMSPRLEDPLPAVWLICDRRQECSRNVQIVQFISIHMRSFRGRSTVVPRVPICAICPNMSQSTHPVSLRKSPKRTVTDSSSGGFACMAHRGFDDQVSCKVAQRPPQKDPGENGN